MNQTLAPAVLDWLKSREPQMQALLAELVNSDSPSHDKAAVDATGEIIKRFLAGHGIEVTTEPHDVFGEAIHASVGHAGANDTRPILLMGHRDTVFSPGEAGRRPFRIQGGRAYGPGVADMKSGLVINLFLLAAFKATGGHPGPLAALITSDEEIGSPSSRPIIERMARQSRVVLNGEPGRASGNIVSGRKGGVFLRFAITGRAAHAGVNYTMGRSAIVELAHKVIALQAVTDLDRGVTVNVGVVSGGQGVNTIAPSAKGEIDVRYIAMADRAWALARIANILDTRTDPDVATTWEIVNEFLALEPTPDSEKLLDLYVDVAAGQGARIAGEFTGGCADSGFTAAQGTPTLCGLGAVGGGAHTPEEYIELPTLLTRAQALAAMISRLGETGL